MFPCSIILRDEFGMIQCSSGNNWHITGIEAFEESAYTRFIVLCCLGDRTQQEDAKKYGKRRSCALHNTQLRRPRVTRVYKLGPSCQSSSNANRYDTPEVATA